MNIYKITGYIFVWLLIGLLNTLILRQFFDLEIGVLLAHSLGRAIVFASLGILINIIIWYGNFATLPVLQRGINYSLLAVFAVVFWLSLGIVFDFIFLENNIAKIFLKINFIYAPFGLVFSILIMQYLVYQKNTAIKEQDIFLKNEILETDNQELKPVKKIGTIAVKTNSKINVISVAEIYFIASEGDYVMICTDNSKHLKEQTMKYFELHLPDNFLRVHRSYIVNVEKISRIELLEKQTYYLFLKNNQKIKMSINGYKNLRRKLEL